MNKQIFVCLTMQLSRFWLWISSFGFSILAFSPEWWYQPHGRPPTWRTKLWFRFFPREVYSTPKSSILPHYGILVFSAEAGRQLSVRHSPHLIGARNRTARFNMHLGRGGARGEWWLRITMANSGNYPLQHGTSAFGIFLLVTELCSIRHCTVCS
jgi:hypothetical protein